MKVYLQTLDGLRKIYEVKYKGITRVLTIPHPSLRREYEMTEKWHRGKRVFLEVL